MRLAEVLNKWRKLSDLTVRQTAAMIGVNSSTYSRIERGEMMDGATLAKVLRWMMEETSK